MAPVKPIIVIPSLNPDERLPNFVRALRAQTDAPILLVDDGSREDRKPRFAECRDSFADVTVLTHDVNRGKGRALKTAFAWILEHAPDAPGCVTADGDGEHAVEDLLRCMESLASHPEAVTLGCREFFGKGAPFKSWFGNSWMRLMFLLVSGRVFKDTQTGLRAFPASFLPKAVSIPGERFEYESKVLLEIGSAELVQIPIRTIYSRDETGTRETHFHPIRDSIRISRVVLLHGMRRFGLFVAAGLSSFAIDEGLCYLLLSRAFPNGTPGRLFLATGIARVVSGVYNYLVNRYLVFPERSSRGLAHGHSFYGYALLAVCIYALSYGFTKLGTVLFAGQTANDAGIVFFKMGIDFTLFLLSYVVQRVLIFRPRSGA